MQNLRLLPIGISLVFEMLKSAEAQRLDLFAIATQERWEPKVGRKDDWYDTMRPKLKSDVP
jgi:hypothetical protein